MPFSRTLGTKPSQTPDQLRILHQCRGSINEAPEHQIVVRRSHPERGDSIILLRRSASPILLELEDREFFGGEFGRDYRLFTGHD